MGSKQVVPLPIKENQGVMSMKAYSTLPRASEQKPHHLEGVGLTPQQEIQCSKACWLVGCLVGFLWYINLCRLFNTKSIFIQIISFISNNSV